MATVRRLAISTLAFLSILALAAGPSAEVSESWQRLHSLPIELRNHLAEQLKVFDTLDRAEQDVVRTLDRQVSAEADENRANYYAVLRRFHLWVQSLPEAQRTELLAAAPSQRMAMVTKILKERPASDKLESSLYHFAELGGISLFDQAEQINIWLELTDAERAEVAKLGDSDRDHRLSALAHEKKIAPIARPSAQVLEAAHEKVLKSEKFAFLKNVERTEVKKPEKSKQARKKLPQQFIDNYYFIEYRPTKVGPDKLLQFERALPSWIRGSYETLPPEEARRRLTILYRLVFPTGEMRADRPKANASATSPAHPAPASKTSAPPKPATGVNPF